MRGPCRWVWCRAHHNTRIGAEFSWAPSPPTTEPQASRRLAVRGRRRCWRLRQHRKEAVTTPALILALAIYIALSVMRYRRDKRLMFAWHAGYGACMDEHIIAAGTATELQAEWGVECLPAHHLTTA